MGASDRDIKDSLFFKGLSFVLRFWAAILLMKFFRRRRDIWIFGGWYGKRFADNSKALFLYVANRLPAVRAIWLSRDENIVKDLRKAGYESYLANSARGFYYSAKAKFHICDQEPNLDINSAASPGAICVYLFHGLAIKKVESFWMHGRDGSLRSRMVDRLRRALRRFFCWTEPYLTVTSRFTAEMFKRSFGLPDEKILMTGYPRTDLLLDKDWDLYFKDDGIEKALARMRMLKKEGNMIMFYAPTFRENVDDVFLGAKKVEELKEFDSFLGRNEMRMVIKGHYVTGDRGQVDFRNIVMLDEGLDINPLLKEVDCFITDYSSGCYDFMLLDRPMIFYPYDYKDYEKKDRGFSWDYQKYTPGEKVDTLKGLMRAMKDVKAGVDAHADDRKRVTKAMYKKVDGKASDRTMKALLKL